MLSILTLTFLPFISLFIVSLLPAQRHQLKRISPFWIWILIFVFIFAVGLCPQEVSTDKGRYVRMYFSSLYNYGNYEFRDPGWVILNHICGKLFGNTYELFFLLLASMYVISFFVVGSRLFYKEYAACFFIMCVGCLGFSSYGINVIRVGGALSLLLISFSLEKKILLRISLLLISLSFHKSMVIPIFAFFLAKYLKNTKLLILIWIGCFFLSAFNFDMGPLFESVGFVDERIESYAGSIELNKTRYEVGFRVDFLIYSIVPLVFAYYYVMKHHLKDTLYLHIIRTYLLANSVWLLAIRIVYSDRLAYLSWFMIPFITLYPVLKYPRYFRNPQFVTCFVMYVFMGIRLLLALRQII